MKERKRTAARVILTLLTIAAIAAIFYNSSRSAVESTEQSSPLTEWLNSLFAKLPIPFSVTETMIRKAAHFTEYTMLGVLMTSTVYQYVRRRAITFWLTLALGAVVAVCDEIIQLFPAGRSCEIRDMLIDTGGVAFGALIVMLFISIIEKRRFKKKEGKENRE